MSFPALYLFFLLSQITGGEFSYVVMPGDSLTSVGARFGVDVRVIAENNQLEATSRLKIGQSLRIDNRHIVPESRGTDIVINVPQRMLFYYRGGGVFRHYPIAAGKRGWRTPIAEFSVVSMERDPVWDVPLSIQEEMRKNCKPVITSVPPSPQNPLGKYWIGLSLPAVGIHGTNAPVSIYKLETHGCIRLHPEDVEDLFTIAHAGDLGRIIHETDLLAKIGDFVFFEIHPDPYRKGSHSLADLNEIARAAGFFDMVDWALVEDVIRKRDGIARDVTRR